MNHQIGEKVDAHVIQLVALQVTDVVCDDVIHVSGKHAQSLNLLQRAPVLLPCNHVVTVGIARIY